MRLCCALPTITLLALAQTFGISTEALAQDTPPIAEGQRVRVSTESGATHEGLVTAISAGGLQLQGEDGSLRFSVPIASMTQLEVSRGQRSKAGVGFLVGAGGGVLGTLVYCGGENCLFFDEDLTPAMALIWGTVGGVVGALVGWTIKADRWEGVPLDRVRVSFPHGSGRFGLGFSVRSSRLPFG
jgi:hypothetical protein